MATIVPEPNAFARATEERRAITRNLAELPWVQYPGHFNQALSKAIVTPATVGSRFFDHRISSYEAGAHDLNVGARSCRRRGSIDLITN